MKDEAKSPEPEWKLSEEDIVNDAQAAEEAPVQRAEDIELSEQVKHAKPGEDVVLPVFDDSPDAVLAKEAEEALTATELGPDDGRKFEWTFPRPRPRTLVLMLITGSMVLYFLGQKDMLPDWHSIGQGWRERRAAEQLQKRIDKRAQEPIGPDRIILHNGQLVKGTIVRDDDDVMWVHLPGGEFQLQKSEIKKVYQVDE